MRCDVALYEPLDLLLCPFFRSFCMSCTNGRFLLYFSLPPLTISFSLFIRISYTLVARLSHLLSFPTLDSRLHPSCCEIVAVRSPV